jgi:hypothetical protein
VRRTLLPLGALYLAAALIGYSSLRDLGPAPLHALWLGRAHEYCCQWLAGGDGKLPGAASEPAAVADELADAAWTVLKGRDRT